MKKVFTHSCIVVLLIIFSLIEVKSQENEKNVVRLPAKINPTKYIPKDMAIDSKVIHVNAFIDARDGAIYNWVKIGEQVWMAENLNATKYNDGAAIPNVTDKTTWEALTSGAYCWNNNDAGNGATYGVLYNWYAVRTSKLCPVGWHVPTDAEWMSLSDYLGGLDVAGVKMKEAGTAHWHTPNIVAHNQSGFKGLPGGYRGSSGTFYDVGSLGLWWSSTELSITGAWFRGLHYNKVSMYRNYSGKYAGFSVRCVRD